MRSTSLTLRMKKKRIKKIINANKEKVKRGNIQLKNLVGFWPKGRVRSTNGLSFPPASAQAAAGSSFFKFLNFLVTDLDAASIIFQSGGVAFICPADFQFFVPIIFVDQVPPKTPSPTLMAKSHI